MTGTTLSHPGLECASVRSMLIPAFALLVCIDVAADDVSPRPLPDNKPCPYPEKAQKLYLAGPVHFTVEVRSDGTVASVEVRKVPGGGLGFEETVRECLSSWRYEPTPEGETRTRRHVGQIAFRLDPAKEAAVRGLFEALAAAWNARDLNGLEDLALRSDDAPGAPAPQAPLRAQLEGRDKAEAPWRMELEPAVEHIRFLGPDLVSVRQRYRRVPAGQSGEASGDDLTLDAHVARGSRGWRFLGLSSSETAWRGVRVGGEIREPRKVKDVAPVYPDIAKSGRIQGVVILECVISPEGKVTSVRVLRGIPVLDEAAMKAVRQWEYTPTILYGQPVPVIMTVTVNFRLTQ